VLQANPKAKLWFVLFCFSVLFIHTLFLTQTLQAENSTPSFSSSGYFRYSSWTNASGYLPVCQGLGKAPSNFGRLGHECGYYGDLGLKRQDESWDFSIRAAVFGDGYHPWENSDQDQKEWQLVEAFVQDPNPNSVCLTFFVLKLQALKCLE
jgi:maltoporin